jgi:hypothetical protein
MGSVARATSSAFATASDFGTISPKKRVRKVRAAVA